MSLIKLHVNKTVTKSDFIDAFFRFGRNNQFTMEGLEALYDYQSAYSLYHDLDIMWICCNFVELTPEQIVAKHVEDCDQDCDLDSIVSFLRKHTVVIPVENGNYVILNA